MTVKRVQNRYKMTNKKSAMHASLRVITMQP